MEAYQHVHAGQLTHRSACNTWCTTDSYLVKPSKPFNCTLPIEPPQSTASPVSLCLWLLHTFHTIQRTTAGRDTEHTGGAFILYQHLLHMHLLHIVFHQAKMLLLTVHTIGICSTIFRASCSEFPLLTATPLRRHVKLPTLKPACLSTPYQAWLPYCLRHQQQASSLHCVTH